MTLVAGWFILGLGVGGALAPTVWHYVDMSRGAQLALSCAVLMPSTGILFGLLAWRVTPAADLIGYSVVAAVAAPLSAIDLAERRLPSRLVLPAYPGVLAAFVTAAIEEHSVTALGRSLVGAAGLFLFFLLLAFTSGGGIGAGDVRLAGLLGLALAWRSWAALVTGSLLGLVCAACVGAALIVSHRGGPRTPIPLGPALLAGALATALARLG